MSLPLGLNHQCVPFHRKVLFADGVIEEFQAVVVDHGLHTETTLFNGKSIYKMDHL